MSRIIPEGRVEIPFTSLADFMLENPGQCRCEWCGRLVHCLTKHHFPISKNNGGRKTVNICGACHNDFHYLEHRGVDKVKYIEWVVQQDRKPKKKVKR